MKDNILQLTPPPTHVVQGPAILYKVLMQTKQNQYKYNFQAPSPGQVYAGELANIQLRWTSPVGPGRT